MPICTGEDIYLKEDFMPLLESGGVAVIHPDLLTSGGILETKKIGDVAQDHGVAMAIHMAESPIAAMAAAHVAVATENFLALEHHSVDVPWWDDIVIGLPKPLVQDGFIDGAGQARPRHRRSRRRGAQGSTCSRASAASGSRPSNGTMSGPGTGPGARRRESAAAFASAEVAARLLQPTRHDHDRDQGHRAAAKEWVAALQEIGAATVSSTLLQDGHPQRLHLRAGRAHAGARDRRSGADAPVHAEARGHLRRG